MIMIVSFEWQFLLFIFSFIRNMLGFGRERNVRFDQAVVMMMVLMMMMVVVVGGDGDDADGDDIVKLPT